MLKYYLFINCSSLFLSGSNCFLDIQSHLNDMDIMDIMYDGHANSNEPRYFQEQIVEYTKGWSAF